MVAQPQSQQAQIVPLMQKGVTVGVLVEVYPKPFMAYPIVHALPEDEKKGFWLKLSTDSKVEVFQDRRHVRIPMSIPFECQYRLFPQGKPIKIPAKTEDVSGGGLKFTSGVLLAVGQEIEMIIQFNPELPVMQLQGKVVMARPNMQRKRLDDLYTVACEFINMDDARETIIMKECFRRELKRKD
jgi:c-di-GMP-binding flagellar brake protein YcgR